jgi:hypothetical protein
VTGQYDGPPRIASGAEARSRQRRATDLGGAVPWRPWHEGIARQRSGPRGLLLAALVVAACASDAASPVVPTPPVSTEPPASSASAAPSSVADATPSAPPTVAPSDSPLSTLVPPSSGTTVCRAEIGDPTREPIMTGLRPAAYFDAYNPIDVDEPHNGDPMAVWNARNVSVSDAGVVRALVGDRLWRHPVSAAQFGLASLREYHETGDPIWIVRAETALTDSMAGADASGRLPYLFPWRGADGVLQEQPAYSAMAQGQSLSLALRMFQLTADERWRQIADGLFETIAEVGTTNPAVTFVDTDGYLWFEEFSIQCPGRVWNGHVVVIFAMADYYQLSGDARALELFDAGATTALAYMPFLRRDGEPSMYDISHAHGASLAYHHFMIRELRFLGAMTGSSDFDRWADLMVDDAPAP